jgi:alpha-L-fucosidase
VLVTKHHDGVLLWPSATPNPNKQRWGSDRDIVGDLATAVRHRGLRFGTYYSGGLDWSFGGLPMRDFQQMLEAIPQTDEFVAYVRAHWDELIERYQPDVLWADIGSPAALDLPALFEHYYAAVPEGVINNRFDWMRQSVGQMHCDFVTPEYSTKGSRSRKWETCRGVGTSFGYNREEDEASYLSADELVRMFVDVVANGGNLLLNVGPNGDGTIPFIQAQRLLALGWWLRTNGDAIYGTRPWSRIEGATSHGLDVRYTTRDGAVFAVVCGTPASDVVELDVTPAPGATVRVLGQDADLPWEATSAGCVVTLPVRPADTPAFALRLSAV